MSLLDLDFRIVRIAVTASLLLVTQFALVHAQSVPPVTLAADGQAQMPVVVPAGAATEVRAAADELADYLGRISGAEFEVVAGTAEAGIYVGVRSDFTNLPFDVDFNAQGAGRDQFVLRTTDQGLYLVGTTPEAVECAVWDFLRRQGYRLFFLTDTWEVIPEQANLTVALDVSDQPDYLTRQAPRGAPWSNRDLIHRWKKRNRMRSSFQLDTGHAYGGIVSRNRNLFEAHPEYYALVGEERPSGGNAKFCVSNAGLRKLVVDDAVRRMEAKPERESVSMDPSDGGGWCQCDACVAMGSPSDRALTLANDVAEAINDLGLGKKYVGMYAYNDHSPPPDIKAHPGVVISIATSFIRGGYSIEDLVSGWQAQDATIGIRDYHDVFAWSHDLPRRARGGKISYLSQTIPFFYQHGARFMNSENSDSWGANGLGYWLTPELLWDVDHAADVDVLIEDFLDKAFGPTKEPMRTFYHLVSQDHDSVRSSEDVIARMYRSLDAARRLTDDDQIQARLDDLILYTRYVELYARYRKSDGDARQQAFEQVWRHTYRMRDRMMLSTVSICSRDRYRDRSVQIPENATWDVPEDENPWKDSTPFVQQEIADILAAGIAANQPTELDFVAQSYSEDLVPATALNLPEVKPGQYSNRYRGRNEAFTWFDQEHQQIELNITGGLIKHYRDRGNVKLSLHSNKEVTLDAVAQDNTVPPDGDTRTVVLESPYDGLHRVVWSDGSDMTSVQWPSDLPITFQSSIEQPMNLSGRWDLYFYVPKQTTVVGGYTDSTRGRMLDGDGKLVFDFSSMDAAGYFSVQVEKGQDAAFWKFEDSRGSRMLMTVPPYLAPHPSELLLPQEIVASDAARPSTD